MADQFAVFQADDYLFSHRLRHWILGLSVCFFIVAIAWAKFAVLEEVTVASGSVIPSSKLQMIQNLEGGIVEKIFVNEGDVVEKGDVLMQIDDKRFSASYQEGYAQITALKTKVARLQAELNNQAFRLPDQKSDHGHFYQGEKQLFDSRKQQYRAQLSALQKNLLQRQHELSELNKTVAKLKTSYQLIEKEVKLSRPLLAEGAVSEVELLHLERQSNDLKGDWAASKERIKQIEAAIAEAENRVSELKSSHKTEILGELNSANVELASLQAQQTAHQDRVKRTAITSPVRGTVKQIHVSTIGGVIQPGKEVIEIVPLDDTLLIEARIRPADIGFVHPGQKAMVKITAYDFSIYGGLPAKVEHISADTLKDEREESYYKIYVRTEKNFLPGKEKPLMIIPGMHASVDILTGKKSVLDYLLKPVLKAKQNALRER